LQEKPYIYQMNTQVRDYECDSRERLKMGFLLKFIQQISGEHLYSLGLPYDTLFEEGKIFVLARLGLRILRRPHAEEEIIIRTSPQGTRGAQFFRQVILYDRTGTERLCEVQAAWLIIDPHTRKILRPDQFGHQLPCIPDEERMPEDYAANRIKPKGEIIHTGQKQVLYSDIDLNGHLNNTVYADIVTDHLPFEKMSQSEIAQMVINYHSEAKYGETLDLTTRLGEDGWYYVSGYKGETCCFEAKVLFAE